MFWSRSGWALVGASVIFSTASDTGLFASDHDVYVCEIHYHPAVVPSSEFVEIHNRGDTSVDVSGWLLSGGVRFVFPAQTSIGPRARIVVARDGESLRDRHGIDSVVGDYDGRLDDDADRFDLRNEQGLLIDRVAYDDDEPWDRRADGRGPSLERMQPLEDGTQPLFWRASRTIGGTPGAESSRGAEALSFSTLIGATHEWAYRKGITGPSTPANAWTERLFDDSSWDRGASGFGYARAGLSTVLDDMQGGYTTLYLRARFSIERPDRARSVLLSVRYEDGYVAYLNGRELARSDTAGPEGVGVDFDDTATRVHEADSVLAIHEISNAPGLRDGDNVVAIHALNVHRNSNAFAIQPTLRVMRDDTGREEGDLPNVEINEVHRGEMPAESFVELFNEGDESVELGGFRLQVDSRTDDAYEIEAGTTLDAGGIYVVNGEDLPIDPDGLIPRWIGLLSPGGHYVDGLRLRSHPQGLSFGRFPDGDGDTFILDSPTPGAANTVDVAERIVINEIRFHPPRGEEVEEFIELFNRGDEDVELDGWRLTGAVRYTFGPTILSAGSYLVIAKDPVAVGARYGITGVRGPWSGRLSNGAETVRLVDSLSNRVDVVRYADDGRWPDSPGQTGADGGGASIELVHPGTDNNAGSAWRASAGTGSPGGRNGRYTENPGPVLRSPRHLPPSPRSTEPVLVSVRATDQSGMRGVTVFFRDDGAGLYSSRPMYDDGLHGDGLGDDGRFAATLPTRPDGTIVEFYFEATDDTGIVSRMPRDAPTRSCLYRVDDVDHVASLPLYRVLLRDADFRELRTRDLRSDDLLDATLIVDERILYNVGLRYRGENSREHWRKPFRLRLSDDEPLDGIDRVNLAVLDADVGHIAQSFLRRADIPVFASTLLALTVNGSFQSSHGGIYQRLEAYETSFLDRQFPGDADGNLYRGRDLGAGTDANLVYRGGSPGAYRTIYEKETNSDIDDYSDVIELTDVLTNTSDARYLDRVSELLDVDEWLRVLATQMILSNQDGSIATNAGEDYYIYRRPSTGRWVLLIWDQAEGFRRPGSGLFRMSSPSVLRLTTHPLLIRRYLTILQSMLDGPFSVEEMLPRLDLLRQHFDDVGIDELGRFVVEQQDALRRLLPQKLTVGVQPTYFVRSGDLWRYWIGHRDPPEGWAERDYDDSRWAYGCGGFGFGDGDDCTGLEEEMRGDVTTVFLRHDFELADPERVDDLTLSVRFDDGYVLFLNGVEIHRRNVSGEVRHDSVADDTREADAVEIVDLRDALDLLVVGTNVIAVVGVNVVAFSNDMTIDPEIYTSPRVAGCSNDLLVGEPRITVGGTAPSTSTVSVRVDGDPAVYDPRTGRWHGEIAVLHDGQLSVVSSVGELGETLETERVTLISSPEPTRVSGSLSTTRWSAASSPYVVSGELRVDGGRTLTIDAGVTVLLEPGSSLVVRGRLEVNGTASDPVSFRAVDCGHYWGGILLAGPDARGMFTHCVIERAIGMVDGPLGRRGALHVTHGARLVLDACAVSEVDGWAVVSEGESNELRVVGSSFDGTVGGVLNDSGFARIERSTISRLARGAHGIELISSSTPRSVIRDSRVEDGGGDGIRLTGSNAWIEGTTVRRTGGSGVVVSGPGTPYVETTIVYDCADGIAARDGARLRCRRVTLTRNLVGVQVDARTNDVRVARVELDSAIVRGNHQDLWLEGRATVELTFSNIAGGFPGEGNIDVSPMFRDVAAEDFRLQDASPSRGAGRDGADQGAFGSEAPTDGTFLRGDANFDGGSDLSDAVRLLGYLFRGEVPSRCLDASDVDDNGEVEITDAVYLLTFLFRGGDPPAAPYPLPGVDPTTDDPLSCG